MPIFGAPLSCVGLGLASKQDRDVRRGLCPLSSPPLSPQAQPTDMRALQDFEEPDKLHIQMNDIITVIEGRYCTGWEGSYRMAGWGAAGIAWQSTDQLAASGLPASLGTRDPRKGETVGTGRAVGGS